MTESPPLEVPPPRPLTEDIVTLHEMTDLFGVKRVTVDQWALRRQTATNDRALPVHDDKVGDKPVWRLERLAVWAQITGKPFHEDVWRKNKAAGAYERATRRITK